MKKTLLLSILATFFALSFAQYPGGNDPYRGGGYGNDDDDHGTHHHDNHRQSGKKVQLALILDASGSMNGLINQAKSQFWAILNQLNYSYEGGYPQVEVAIFDYGSKYASRSRGYVRRLTPLTTDLDWAADKLYDIRTGGRHEYAGYAIQSAIDNLDWDRRRGVDKIIFIAGNESLDQGRTDYLWAIQNAASRGIAVHTVFCGDYDEGIHLGWADAAYYGGGMYTALDQNSYDRHHHYPQDNDLWSLNSQFNNTYIPYGAGGRDRCDRQRRQDRYAYGYGVGHAAHRAMYKASYGYNNPDWDLVDAYRMGRVNLSTMSNSDFPADMQRMTLAQKEQHIKRKADERQRLRQRMQGLATVRQESVKRAEITKANRGVSGRATNGKAPVRTQSLDQAIGQSVGKKMNRVPVATKPASSRSTSAVEARPSSWSQPKTRQATPPTSSRGTVNRNSSATSRNTRVVRPAPSPRTSSNTRTSSSTRTRPNPSSSTRSSSSASTRSNPSTSTRSSSRTSPSRSTTVRSAPSPSRRATIKRPAPTPKPAPRATPSPRRSAPVAKPKVEKKVTPAPRQAPKPASSRSMMSRKIRN